MSGEDFDRRIASLETEVRSMREEVQLNRRRYHELSNQIAPLILEGSEVQRHELELRDLRSALDRFRGVWTAITIMGGVISALAAAVWTVFSHLPFGATPPGH